MVDSVSPSAIDVVRDALGRDLSEIQRREIPPDKLLAVAGRLSAFYDTWDPPTRDPGEFWTFFSRWPIRNRGELDPCFATGILSTHRTIIEDPLMSWLKGGDATDLGRPSDGQVMNLRWGVEAFRDLAPLMDAGVVVPIPPSRYAREWKGAWDQARAHITQESEEWLQQPFMILDPGTLELAERGTVYEAIYLGGRYGAQYQPEAKREWELLVDRLERACRELDNTTGVALAVAPALMSAELPFLKDLSAAELATVRESDEAFGDWLSQLRTAVRTIRAQPGGPHFDREAGEVLRDALLPAAHRISAAVNRSRTLKQNARGPAAGFLGGAIGSMMMHAGLPAADALLASGLTALNTWALQSLFPDNNARDSSVLAQLVVRS